MIVEKNAAMMTSAAKTFAYSAQPCAQFKYQPRPAFTPTVSTTISVRNDEPNPMNKPMKMLGIAARYTHGLTDLREEGTPDAVRTLTLTGTGRIYLGKKPSN